MTLTAAPASLDLDTELEPDVVHARCTYCQPESLAPGTIAESLCGVLFRTRLPTWPEDSHPPNACLKCLALWRIPCERCGHL